MTRKTDWLNDRAEGTVAGYPYTTELVNCDGVTVHFWLGDNPSRELASELRARISRERDVVGCTFSEGAPTGFWARENHN